MHPILTATLARSLTADRLRAADEARRAREVTGMLRFRRPGPFFLRRPHGIRRLPGSQSAHGAARA